MPTGINNHGEIVGNRGASNTEFLYSGGQLFDLSTLILSDSSFLLTGVSGISDSDQIVGTAFVNGFSHAVVLTPVPEPTGLALFGFGTLALLACSCWRRHAA